MINKLICILILFMFSIVALYAVDVDAKKADLDINVCIVPEYYIALPSMNTMFKLDSVSFELEGELKNGFSFKFETDFAELLNTDTTNYSAALENAYVQYKFFRELKIRSGLFKLPVSEGLFLGLNERPAIDHFYAVKQLTPGRNIGIMIHGKKIFDLFGYDLGLFNSVPLTEIGKAQSDLSLASKLYIKTNIGSKLDFKAGYSIYYSFSEIFTHSVFLHTLLEFTENHSISLFAEYLEQRYYNYHWNSAFTALLSWRLSFFEVFFNFEHFDKNTGEDSADDRIILSPGLNFYTSKDKFRAGIQYTAEKQNERNFTHEISVNSVFLF